MSSTLKAIALPQSDGPLPLLAFNLGVEAGQFLFVAAALALAGGLDRLLALRAPLFRAATAYAIGSVAAVWVIERTAVATFRGGPETQRGTLSQ